MSMISHQCDELRRVADKDNVSYEASDVMYRAADTIWELSCKLADMVDQREEIERLKAENAKLRELARELWAGYNDHRCEECHLKDTPTCADCPICAREVAVIDRMRELGVEVS